MTELTFETHRPHLMGLAYRLLGTVSDAEDMVQNTFLRWREAGLPELDHPRSWFTKTCTRLCLDRLKSARHRRESYVGVWLPEPFAVGRDAEQRQEMDESLSIALLHTVERLRPAERAAFLLHDIFGHSFAEVAEILDLTSSNCRQLASRARRHLEARKPRYPADRKTVQRLSNAFFDAIGSGDLGTLQTILSEDVTLWSDGGGKAAAARRPIHGFEDVSRFFVRIFASPPPSIHFEGRPVTFNDSPGIVVYEARRAVTAFHFDIDGGCIRGIYAQRNPDKLGAFQGV